MSWFDTVIIEYFAVRESRWLLDESYKKWKKRLKKMKDGRFAQLINYMIEDNCKLDQEAIQ